MKARRGLVVVVAIAVVVLVGATAAIVALPGLVRHLAIARLEALTHRPVRIDRVDVDVFRARLALHGLHIADRAPGETLTDLERLDVRVSLLPLIWGHVWIRELELHQPTVRIVRLADGLNVSDLLEKKEAVGSPLNITVDRFALVGGTVKFEDRALPEPRTWMSENIQIEATNVSTRDDKGAARASSVTAGAPTTVTMEQFRLYPIHLKADISVTGLDLSLARLYFPPGAPVVIDQGRATTSLRVTLDARDGVRADATGQLENVALVKAATGERLLVVPSMTSQLTDGVFRDERLAIGRFELNGSASVLNPTARGGPRLEPSQVRASVADLTWPVERHARIDVETSTPGGGTARLTGAVRPPPEASQLRLRLASVNLAPWAQFLPVAARISGQAESDLSIDEPVAAGVPNHLRGSVAVNNLSVRDERREAVAARRIEASGLEVDWPSRVSARRIVVTAPRGTVERERSGELSLRRLWAAPGAPVEPPAERLAGRPPAAVDRGPAATASASGPARSAPVNAPDVTAGEIVVRGGALSWRDAAVTPPAALDFADIDATVRGARWPLDGPVDARLAARPPGGGRIEVEGRVDLDPVSGDVRIRAKDADLSPYRPYVPIPARVSGWADADLMVRVPRTEDQRLTARGTATLSRVDVRDEQRSVLRLERGVATDLDVVWPERINVRELALRRPWILVERDERSAITLRSLLLPKEAPQNGARGTDASGSAAGKKDPSPAANGDARPAVSVRRLVIEEGGARVVDRSLQPSFAVDMSRLAVNAEGLATAASARPARITVSGRIGADSLLDLSGTVGPLEGPLRVDLNGSIQGFWVPRSDPYLLRFVGWEAREGFLTTALRCRIDRDALDAKADIRLSRLVVAKSQGDEAQKRIGLPLGMIVSLMKDRRGDINISLPVGGRIDDPRFDYSEAIWSTLRNATIGAIMLPVSWIGRVKFTPDSRIERIEVDPVRFVPGTATFTAEGEAQVAKLGQFLSQAPESRMRLTPVISRDDLAALQRRLLDPEIERMARDARITKEEAARHLFQQRFPDRTPPADAQAMLAVLTEGMPLPANAAADLAAQRLEAVRAMAKKAGIDQARLLEAPAAEGHAAAGSQVALEMAEPGPPERPGRGPDFLRKLNPKADRSPGDGGRG